MADRIASSSTKEEGGIHLRCRMPDSITSRTASTIAKYSWLVVSVTACTWALVTTGRTSEWREDSQTTEKSDSSRSHAAAPRLSRGGSRASERFPCMSGLREGLGCHTWVTRPSRRSICAVVCTCHPTKIHSQIGRTDHSSRLAAKSVR